MSFINTLTNKIVNFIINRQLQVDDSVCRKIEGISKDIQVLRELKDELIEKDKELKNSKVEWDKTFDAIIDDITIINPDLIVTKANKSFLVHHHEVCVECVSPIGRSWNDIRNELKIETVCIIAKCFKDKVYQETTMNILDKTYSVLANPIFDDNDNIISVVRVARDITNLEQQKQKIDRRGRIFEAISEMSKTLVSHEIWHEALTNVLNQLGKSVGASRTYIFKNVVNDDRLCADLMGEWVNIESCHMTECINYDTLPDWKYGMESGKAVEGRIKECLHCPDKDTCIGLNDLIVCAVPIYSNKKWWGFIGFDYNTDIKKWKEEDEALLRVASDIIGGVIFHRDRYFKCLNSINQ